MIDLKGIIAISGQPGLYKIIASSKNGFIVEGLADKKRLNIFSTTKVSNLAEISMFTTGEDKPIAEIMFGIFEKENGNPAVDHKAEDAAIEKYFSEILPDYDKERVYVSNMRKLFGWYNLLQSTGNLKKKEEGAEDEKAPEIKTEDKGSIKKHGHDSGKVKTSHGVVKTAGVRKTGAA